MPSLASMRSIDPAGDSFQPLGPPVRSTEKPAEPAPKPTQTPGVVQMPDGKLQTNLPLPSAPVKMEETLTGTLYTTSSTDKQWSESVDLTEASLEAVCKEIQQHVRDRGAVMWLSAPRSHGKSWFIDNYLQSPKILGKRADFIVVDDLEPCSTCQGTSTIFQEHQRGCHVGGYYECPDCNGSGE